MSVIIFPQLENKMDETKPLVKSKTFWVNALVLAAGIATYVSGHELIVEHPAVVSILTVVIGGINVALRFITNKAIK